jgi:hypothetical protein
MSVSLRRGAIGLAFATALVAGLSPAVHADNLEALGDELSGKDNVALGTVCAGDPADTELTFQLLRNGDPNANVWDKSTTVAIAPGTPSPNARGVLTLGSTSATTPSTWLDSKSQASVTSGAASVSLAVPADAPAGDASVTVTYSATGKAAEGTAPVIRNDTVTFTWTVEDCAPSDTSAPEISHLLDPATPDGDNGWYVSDVSIDWTVVDGESDVTGTVGCLDETFVSDGTFTPECSATSAGGTAGPVTVDIKRDATVPEVAFTGGPADGSSYWYGDPIPGPSTCSASDETSQVTEAGCSVTGGGTAVGSYEQSASARDNAGNSTTITRSYEVKRWTLDGFYRPVVMDNAVVNTVKAGSTVPLKFNVLKGSTPMTADIGAKFTTTKASCETGDAEDPIELVTTGSTSLRYDTAAGQWVQNWATPSGGKGYCYRVTMTTADGSAISADFKLK